MPIWKPFMAWMAVWALDGLSKLTKPEEEVTQGKNQAQTRWGNGSLIYGKWKQISHKKKVSKNHKVTLTITNIIITVTHRSIYSGWWRGRRRPSQRWRFRRAGTSAVSQSRWTPVAGGRWRCYSPRDLHTNRGEPRQHRHDMTSRDRWGEEQKLMVEETLKHTQSWVSGKNTMWQQLQYILFVELLSTHAEVLYSTNHAS